MKGDCSQKLKKIYEILERQSKKDFVLLPRTKALEKTVRSLLAQVDDEVEVTIREELEGLLRGFDDLPFFEKKERLIQARVLLKDYLMRGASEKHFELKDRINACPTLEEYRANREVLERPVSNLQGIGPKLAKRLAKKDIHTVEDLLYFVPRDYHDRRSILPLSHLQEGQKAVVYGEVLKSGPSNLGRKRIYEVLITDGTGYLSLKWFNFKEAVWRSLYPLGKKLYAYGEVSRFGRNLEMLHPEVVEEGDEATSLEIGKIVPIYFTVEGISHRLLRKIMKRAVEDYLPYVNELIPEEYFKKTGFLPLRVSLRKLHEPDDNENLSSLRDGRSIYHKSLAFEEFFFLELALAWRRGKIKAETGIAFKIAPKVIEDFLAKLPFDLTPAQKRVFEEIKRDMASPIPMNRLLQGDVGCGKTIIAFLAALIAIENGYQVALMAPTEILAEQHLYNFRQYNQLLGIQVALLTGSVPPSRKREVCQGLKIGYIQFVIGTHALFQEAVEFKRLGLVIIDEQHRFGVLQRAELRAKAREVTPDTLVMTATPIPRTLALTIYGDLDVSIIDEMPKGRKPVLTKLFLEPNKVQAYELVKSELRKGHQAYVILPLIEESEALDLKALLSYGEELKKRVFSEFKVDILHGKMSGQEKERIMQGFKRGEIQVLISTTVVEVGVDVPNATVMVIEHAERFGLSQLHQLRGRVGRSDKQSYCYLIAYKVRFGSEAFRRLEVLTKTTDGFKIAEEDLKLRGPGEFLGTKQSGYFEFRRADLVRDYEILLKARECAFDLLKEDPGLTRRVVLKEELFRRWKERLKLLEVA